MTGLLVFTILLVATILVVFGLLELWAEARRRARSLLAARYIRSSAAPGTEPREGNRGESGE